ncbi:hypothetical protein ACN95_12745 [Gordonia sihwensis]|nr:hypothetical protein [Gordonia sihwensis]
MIRQKQMSSSNETHDRERSGSRLRGRLGDTGWTRARAIASLGMVFGLGAVGTMAAWSDTATATTGMFSTAAVDVRMDLHGDRPTHQFASLAKLNLAKGATVAGMLPVNNIGGSDFDYTMKAVSADSGTATYGDANAGTFAQNLKVNVYRGGSSNGTVCSGGTAIATGKALTLGTTDIITTNQRVNKNTTDNLCFQITLDSNAPNSARMSALSVKFNFAATQA